MIWQYVFSTNLIHISSVGSICQAASRFGNVVDRLQEMLQQFIPGIMRGLDIVEWHSDTSGAFAIRIFTIADHQGGRCLAAKMLEHTAEGGGTRLQATCLGSIQQTIEECRVKTERLELLWDRLVVTVDEYLDTSGMEALYKLYDQRTRRKITGKHTGHAKHVDIMKPMAILGSIASTAYGCHTFEHSIIQGLTVTVINALQLSTSLSLSLECEEPRQVAEDQVERNTLVVVQRTIKVKHDCLDFLRDALLRP